MYNSNIPDDRQLPSTKKLVKSTILAAVTALFLLVAIVMPAEYGMDPTGFGKMTGLQKMGEIKMSLAEEAEAEKLAATQATAPVLEAAVPEAAAESVTTVAEVEPAAANAADISDFKDTMTVTLKPNEGAEIKVEMQKGQKTTYVWWTDGGRANFDVHGDSKTLGIDYHNYSKGSEQRREGEIVAAFDGGHGWFWRNRTKDIITLTLQTNGDYSAIKRVK